MVALANRVRETTATTGTGSYTLDGSTTGYQAFSVLGDGTETYYVVTDDIDWEIGIGILSVGTVDTLSRNIILDSSNNGNAVNWSAGSKDIFIDVPASFLSPPIEDFQEASTGAHLLDSGDFGKTLTNAGATALVEFDLPAVLKGDGPLTFVVVESFGIQVNLVNTGDVIRVGDLVSTAGTGTIDSSNVGDAVTIAGLTDGVWFATGGVGDWRVL